MTSEIINKINQIEILDIDCITSFEPFSKMLNLPSGAIHIENDISLLQKKIWFELVYYAFPNLGKQREYVITLEKLRYLLGWNETTSNDKELKEALHGLNSKAIQWNIFNKDKKNSWQSFPLLAGCEIPKNSGVCIFSFSSFLEKRFLSMGEEAYIKIDLIISQKFQSKYSLSIYCLALDYLILKMGYSSKKFSVNEIRRYLAIKEGEYKLVGNLNDRVIKPSEKEINEVSDLNIKIEPFKEGKKISGYRLTMELKDGVKEKYLNSSKRFELRNKQTLLIESKEQKVDELEQIKQFIPKNLVNIKNILIRSFFAKYSIVVNTNKFQEKLNELNELFGFEKLEGYLLFLIDYAENEKQNTQINNFSGYFVSLLKDDTQINNYILKLENDEKKKKEKEEQINSFFNQELKEKYDSYFLDNFDLYIRQLVDYSQDLFIEVIKREFKTGFIYDHLICNLNKGIIDKTLLNKPKPLVRFLIKELQKFSNEFGFEMMSFEDWKNKVIENN